MEREVRNEQVSRQRLAIGIVEYVGGTRMTLKEISTESAESRQWQGGSRSSEGDGVNGDGSGCHRRPGVVNMLPSSLGLVFYKKFAKLSIRGWKCATRARRMRWDIVWEGDASRGRSCDRCDVLCRSADRRWICRADNLASIRLRLLLTSGGYCCKEGDSKDRLSQCMRQGGQGPKQCPTSVVFTLGRREARRVKRVVASKEGSHRCVLVEGEGASKKLQRFGGKRER